MSYKLTIHKKQPNPTTVRKKAATTSAIRPTEFYQVADPHISHILHLQRVVGNQAAMRLFNNGNKQLLNKHLKKNKYEGRPLSNIATIQRDDETHWFQEPPKKEEKKTDDMGIKSLEELGREVTVETPTTIELPGEVKVFIRFAFPTLEVGHEGLSDIVKNAKKKIIDAIGKILMELWSTPESRSSEDRIEALRSRAMLKGAFTTFTAKKPINIYIATNPTRRELLEGEYIPTTELIYINEKDVGNTSKLEAGIRIPIHAIIGGLARRSGKFEMDPARSTEDIQKTMLHEMLHVMLINKKIDANSMWATHRKLIEIAGPSATQKKFESIIRLYLIAQEEIFVYKNTSLLCPPVDKAMSYYEEVLIPGATSLFKTIEKSAKKFSLKKIISDIKVKKKVGRKNVKWQIEYLVPELSIDFSTMPPEGLEIFTTFMDALLASWPIKK